MYRFETQISDNASSNIEKDIRQKWATLWSLIASAGITKIYEYYDKQMSQKAIENILSTIPTYTKYKQRKKSKLHNPFFLYFVHNQWQIDITYVSGLRMHNDDIAYLLVVMECFSRKIFVTPMKSKSTTDTLNYFKEIHSYIGISPESIYLDKGSEFNSSMFKDYCKPFKTKLIFAHSIHKASLVERCQRTLQGIMFKFMQRYNTERYIDHL